MISDAFLFFGHTPAIGFFFSIIYWFSSKKEGTHLLLLALISMILNAALKLYFKVPLKPHMADQNWYAFPSGHMQLVSVFYGRLFWLYRQKYKGLWAIIPFLGGYGWALIDQNFHDYADVGAGFVAGVFLLALYQVSSRIMCTYNLEKRIGFLWMVMTLPLLVYISVQSIPVMHAWQAQGGIVGVAVSSMIWQDAHSYFQRASILQKILHCAMGLFGFVMLWLGNELILKPLGYPVFPFISFFFLGLWLGGAADFVWDQLRQTFRPVH